MKVIFRYTSLIKLYESVEKNKFASSSAFMCFSSDIQDLSFDEIVGIYRLNYKGIGSPMKNLCYINKLGYPDDFKLRLSIDECREILESEEFRNKIFRIEIDFPNLNFTETPNDFYNKILDMSDDERLDLFSDFCHGCGKDIREQKCYCMRDD